MIFISISSKFQIFQLMQTSILVLTYLIFRDWKLSDISASFFFFFKFYLSYFQLNINVLYIKMFRLNIYFQFFISKHSHCDHLDITIFFIKCIKIALLTLNEHSRIFSFKSKMLSLFFFLNVIYNLIVHTCSMALKMQPLSHKISKFIKIFILKNILQNNFLIMYIPQFSKICLKFLTIEF